MSALQVGFLKGEIERRDAKIESDAKVIAALRDLIKEAALMLGTSEDEWDRTMARRMHDALETADEQYVPEK